MFRKVSHAEAAECFGAFVREQPKGYYQAKFFTTDLNVALADLLPIDRDDRPFRIRPTATSVTDRNLLELLGVYPGVEYVELYGGDYDGEQFLFSAPSLAKAFLLMMAYDAEASKSYKEQFSRRHDAQWYCSRHVEDAREDEFALYDFWIIPRTEAFDELLERHSQNFQDAVAKADEALRVYDTNRWRFRKYVKDAQLWRIERLGWSIRLYDLEASLLYIRGDGMLDEYVVRYDAYGVDQLDDLLYIAEEAEEFAAETGGTADIPEADRAL